MCSLARMLISLMLVCCYVLQVICAKKGPFPVEVEAVKTYYWCTCGRSKNQVRGGGSVLVQIGCNYAALNFWYLHEFCSVNADSELDC